MFRTKNTELYVRWMKYKFFSSLPEHLMKINEIYEFCAVAHVKLNCAFFRHRTYIILVINLTFAWMVDVKLLNQP